MSISSEISRIEQSKNNITESIRNKGVSVPPDIKIDNIPTYIDSISVCKYLAILCNPNEFVLNENSTSERDEYVFSCPFEGEINSETIIFSIFQIPINNENFTQDEIESFSHITEVGISSKIDIYANSKIETQVGIIIGCIL